MKIRKFVVSNIVLSVVLITTLYGLSYFYINFVNDRTVKFMEYNKFPNNSIEIVSLGSSHGKFGLKLDKENQMNLGLEQQGFYYNLKLLEKYENKIKTGAVVIIPISIFSFNETTDSLKDETYKNYINLLEKKDIKKELKSSEYFLMKNFSVIYPPARLIETAKYLIRKKKIEKNRITYNNNLRGESLKREAQNAGSHIKGFKVKNVNNGINKLIELLEYCEKRKYTPILCIIPTYYLYNEELEKIEKGVFENKIIKNIYEVEKRLGKNYIFLDYSYDERFKNNVEYFIDDDHLNEKGAEYFTSILLNDIAKEMKKENEREI